jgi:ABC-type enterochelin transport system permease subunit
LAINYFNNLLSFQNWIPKEEAMPQVSVYLSTIIYILVALTKLVGTLALGLGIGWLALDVFRKGQHSWQFQVAFFLGLIALLVAFLLYSHLGLGGFGIGMGLAILLWGLPKTRRK